MPALCHCWGINKNGIYVTPLSLLPTLQPSIIPYIVITWIAAHGPQGQAQNNSVIFVQVTKCYIDKTLVSGIPVTSVSWGSVTTKSRVSEHCYNIVIGCHVAHITSTDTLLFNSLLNKCFRVVALPPVKTTKMLFLSKICCWFKSKV